MKALSVKMCKTRTNPKLKFITVVDGDFSTGNNGKSFSWDGRDPFGQLPGVVSSAEWTCPCRRRRRNDHSNENSETPTGASSIIDWRAIATREPVPRPTASVVPCYTWTLPTHSPIIVFTYYRDDDNPTVAAGTGYHAVVVPVGTTKVADGRVS